MRLTWPHGARCFVALHDDIHEAKVIKDLGDMVRVKVKGQRLGRFVKPEAVFPEQKRTRWYSDPVFVRNFEYQRSAMWPLPGSEAG